MSAAPVEAPTFIDKEAARGHEPSLVVFGGKAALGMVLEGAHDVLAWACDHLPTYNPDAFHRPPDQEPIDW